MIRTNNRVALYARFSSDNQRSESIDAQIRAMQTYCQQHDYVIVDTYIDEAKSATTDRRPSFQQMISDSKKGMFDIVLVHKLDRFARNRYDSAVYKRELKKNGVKVYSVLENLDNSPESIMMEAVLEGMAEYYSQNLGREVMKGMKENALNCIHTGGKPPLGYDVDPETKKLVLNEHEAESVRIIFSLYSKGYGYSHIIDVLNSEGRLTKKGEPFRKNSLISILRNPKYQGMFVFNRSSAKTPEGTRNTHLLKSAEEIICIEGGCPQIIDKETYDKAQARIVENKHHGGRFNAKMNYLLTGKVICQHCGRTMGGSNTHNGRGKTLYAMYRCPNKPRSCDNKGINCGYLEKYIVRLLEKEIFSAVALRRILKKMDSLRSTDHNNLLKLHNKIAKELSETEQAISNVANAVASGLLSEALTEKLRELEDKRERLSADLNALGNTEAIPITIDTQAIRSQYKELKAKPDSLEYKNFIQSFIDKIVVGNFDVEITLKTGLGILPELDTTYMVKRKTIYQAKKMV